MTFTHCSTCHKVPCQCPKHMEPNDLFYAGGYETVTRCTGCETIALFSDANPVNPCLFCGGTVKEYHKAAWWNTQLRQWMFEGVPDHNKQEYLALESKGVLTKPEAFMLGFLTGAALAVGFYFGWAFANA